MGPSNERKSTQVLLVEDNRDVRYMYEVSLVRAGVTVSAVANSIQFLDQLDNSHDVYVVDVMLPGVNGLELTRRVRADQPDAAIVIISALCQSDEIKTGMDAGATTYLVKPVSPRLLVETVSSFLATPVA